MRGSRRNSGRRRPAGGRQPASHHAADVVLLARRLAAVLGHHGPQVALCNLVALHKAGPVLGKGKGKEGSGCGSIRVSPRAAEGSRGLGWWGAKAQPGDRRRVTGGSRCPGGRPSGPCCALDFLTHRDVVEVSLVHQLVADGGQVADLLLERLESRMGVRGMCVSIPMGGW